jgi:hypothetical protein
MRTAAPAKADPGAPEGCGMARLRLSELVKYSGASERASETVSI